ncbi:uncharacterized protein SAPINGB_P001416 [Magnusiomyces paraingens]|uniref:Uncharacterized protein n=1 Tax=Magnusiomyces paraingens TaxID=2606893 RepID=A0A5E8B5M1_9ASCO|nr:uncharacterized protein SAPINGB_P001416 [Saprochaete ingens]VVT46845.1 unnamed protein product [Saprochaete ingens]
MPRKSRSSNLPPMPSLDLSQDSSLAIDSSSSDSFLSQVTNNHSVSPTSQFTTTTTTRPKRRQPRRRENTPLPKATPTNFVELFQSQITSIYSQIDAQRRAKLTAASGHTRLGLALKSVHGSRITKAHRRILELRSRAAQKRAKLNTAETEQVNSVNTRFEEKLGQQTITFDDLNKRILELHSEIKKTYEDTLTAVKTLSD